MGQKSSTPDPKRFTTSFSGSLGRWWQGIPRSGQRVRGWLMGKRMGKRSANNRPASYYSGGQLPPPWEPATPGRIPGSHGPFRGLWQRFRMAPGRARVGVAAGAGGLLLISLIGVVALCSHLPSITSGAPGVGSANKHGSPAAIASTTTTPAGPFTITFTCASGTMRGSGSLCVHTQANALLSLSVRYCDGVYAEGKSLRGKVHADGSGDYTWHWPIHTRCAGTATATVEAKSAGQSVTQSTTFTITG